ncbi:MAG: hypothetical protein IJS01_12350 [Lentisphaeria bacterium]|nr:hypothetical protein [Lentisphaeria bacterium]
MSELVFGRTAVEAAAAACRVDRFLTHAGCDGFVGPGADIVFEPRRDCGDRREK